MPHVEIKGTDDLGRFHSQFRPETLRVEGSVLKTLSSYLCHDETSCLIDCHVVEGYLRQNFFVVLSARGRDGTVMVRLLPKTSPEKSDGVKRCVAWVSRLYLRAVSGSKVSGSNIEESLLLTPTPEAEAKHPDS